VLQRRQRRYLVRRDGDILVIRNAAGEELRGRPSADGGGALEVEHPQAGHPYLRSLLQEAAMALGLTA